VERHADHELGLAVAVDVTRRERHAGLVAVLAVDPEAVGAERAEVDGVRAGPATDDVRRARGVPGADGRHGHVVLAVAGEVAGGDGPAGA
jgi:hypothetical protein